VGADEQARELALTGEYENRRDIFFHETSVAWLWTRDNNISRSVGIRARHEALGFCPVCETGQVYALDNSHACENAISAEKTCTFRVGKVILQREIPKEQVQKLITTGKTDLLPKFISKKGRPFSAHLKLEKGKVGFEFAEKAPRVKKAPGRKAAVAKTATE
jgi:hypothetical protein